MKSFKVSRFRRFKFQSFKVSIFQSCKVSKFQSFKDSTIYLMFLIDIDPISCNSRSYWTDCRSCRPRSFPFVSNFSISESLIFPKTIASESDLAFLVFVEVSGCPQNKIELVWGVMVTPARSENFKDEDCSSFSNINPKSYSCKMKQNNSTELLGQSFNNIYSEMTPPRPPRPQNLIFLPEI